MVATPLTLTTEDGLELEAQVDVPDAVTAGVVVAHPHPLYGGEMRNLVVGALFSGLPPAGMAVLRFNFRGVGQSTGEHDQGRRERLDVVAAIDALHARLDGLPLLLAGYSFGGDVALAVDDDRPHAWLAVAAPMRTFEPNEMAAANDPRPKLLLAPQHDQFRAPESAQEAIADWPSTRVEVVPGADHFLVGRTDRVVELALGFVAEVTRAAR